MHIGFVFILIVVYSAAVNMGIQISVWDPE